ncbi:MAG: zinc ribbon domain-containing protein [Chloroflexi bacterium]|nr:zinc ribbon domain-containing protein [Chloroflexota bacterium]
MKNIWKWILGISLVLVLFFGPYLFRLAFPAIGYGYGGMMGSGRGMSAGFSFFPFGMGLMWLVPLGTIALIVLGIVWFFNNMNGSKTVQGQTCSSCSKPVQADWKTCPYCGNTL